MLPLPAKGGGWGVGHAAETLRFGWSTPSRCQNGLEDTVQIATDIGIAHSHDTISHSPEHEVPVSILRRIMGIAIHLDHKAEIATDKVTDKAVQGDLA